MSKQQEGNTMMTVKQRVCPVCRAVISGGKAAMRRHLAKHQNARVAPPPLASGKGRGGRSKRSRSGGVSASAGGKTETGTDVLGTVTLDSSSSSVGDKLLNFAVNPASLEGSRLEKETELWTKWRPRKFTIRCVSSAGSFCNGSYMLGWTANVHETLAAASGGGVIRRVATFERNLSGHISATTSISLPTQATRTWYMLVGNALEDTTHGTVVCVLGSPLSGFTGKVTLTFFVDWAIEFSSPRVTIAGEDAIIYARESYTPYYTNSSSDWQAGAKLSFKAHAGGSLVPFDGLPAGDVLLKTAGWYYSYYTAGTAGAELKTDGQWAVRAKDYSQYPILACVASKEDGEAYLATGNVAKLLTYQQAGNTVNPANPPWKVVKVGQFRLSIGRNLPRRIYDPPDISRLSLEYAESEGGESFEVVEEEYGAMAAAPPSYDLN